MDASDLYYFAKQCGITINVKGEYLQILSEVPVTPQFKKLLSAKKPELMAMIKSKTFESRKHMCKQVLLGEFDKP